MLFPQSLQIFPGLALSHHLASVVIPQASSDLLFLYLNLKVLFFFSSCLFAFSRAAPMAYGGSQATGLVGAVAAGHSHSHTRSEPRLQPTPQLTAMLDP